jgi:LysM repeat protein
MNEDFKKITSFLMPAKTGVMSKFVIIFLSVFFINMGSFAQKDNLVIEGTTPNFYLLHKVRPKENFYSIGRMYNVSPKDLASYNNLQFVNGLSIGQLLKIPLSENNFTQGGEKVNDKALIPVYHTVEPKEGLYRVSINFNKVQLSSLRTWNHLPSDDLNAGSKLIVGFLMVGKNESALAPGGIQNDENIAGITDNSKKNPPPYTDESHERLPPVKVPDKDQQQKKEDAAEQTGVVKNEIESTGSRSSIKFVGGYFKSLYTEQVEKKTPVVESGNAGVFKSTSGWQDGKYYCFSNEASPGSVIKVTDNATNKAIYAKVLDVIPDIKQNYGLSIIISNAAASELGETEQFACNVSFVK